MKRTCWLLQLLPLLPLTGSSFSLASDSRPSTATRGAGFGLSTCPFRTANYITHGLPQQCLRTSRAVSDSANATGRQELSDANGHDASRKEAPSLNTNVVDIATTTSIDLGEKFERPAAAAHSPAQKKGKEEHSPSVDDAEAPIDTAKFLSFEEWKAQNLARAGQSAENFGERPPKEARRRPGSLSSALDALGEDAEIELNFGGEGNEDKPGTGGGGGGGGESDSLSVLDGTKPSETVEPDKHVRSKDAGKTCKERFNYASFDCAATVHKTNPECKGASSILVENKDSYMLNKCGAKHKFIIVELCDDILVDTVVLANYEFFSSMFRTFRVSASDRYPVKSTGWKDLGVFEAKNSREIQAFLIQNPLIWARYIRVEFLTHYGKEFYCPISLLRVHGTTMMEEFRHQEELARGYNEDYAEEIEPEAVAKPIEESAKASREDPHAAAENGEVPPAREMAPALQSTVVAPPDSVGPPHADPTTGERFAADADQASAVGSEHRGRDVRASSPPTDQASSANSAHSPSGEDGSAAPGDERTITSSPVSDRASAKAAKPTIGDAPYTREHTPPRDPVSVASDGRHPSAVSAVTAPTPTTQESFFKTIHKRLQLLEANATLSLQYIEEQSRLMRDTFSKMEKRQFNKSASYLEQLNATVFRELREFRTQYDQLWQSTVIALDTQRELSEREMLAVSARLAMLADEIVFQKRMTIAQSFLMIVVVCIVVFTKTQNLEAGFVRTVFSARNQDHLHLGLESPPTSPSPPAVVPARGSSGGSGGSGGGGGGGNAGGRGKQSYNRKRMREYAHQRRHERRDSSDFEGVVTGSSGGAHGVRRAPLPKRFYEAGGAANVSTDNISDAPLDEVGGRNGGRGMVSPPLEAQLTQSSPATPNGGVRGVDSGGGRAWVSSSASDGEYVSAGTVRGWRATSPLSRQVSGESLKGGESGSESEGGEVPDRSEGEVRGWFAGPDGDVVESYFLP